LKRHAIFQRVIVAGDFNLDLARENDPRYKCKTLVGDLVAAVGRAGLVYHNTPPTWRSYGQFNDTGDPNAIRTHRSSTINHVYSAGVSAVVSVLNDASTDHSPLLTVVSASSVCVNVYFLEKMVRYRNFIWSFIAFQIH
jgi:endonuclease/exonuclease/phosphatase (EEP) superfamily protein YafD